MLIRTLYTDNIMRNSKAKKRVDFKNSRDVSYLMETKNYAHEKNAIKHVSEAVKRTLDVMSNEHSPDPNISVQKDETVNIH